MITIKITFIPESVPSPEFKDSVKSGFTLNLLRTFRLLKYLNYNFINSVFLLAVSRKSFQLFIPCDIAFFYEEFQPEEPLDLFAVSFILSSPQVSIIICTDAGYKYSVSVGGSPVIALYSLIK